MIAGVDVPHTFLTDLINLSNTSAFLIRFTKWQKDNNAVIVPSAITLFSSTAYYISAGNSTFCSCINLTKPSRP